MYEAILTQDLELVQWVDAQTTEDGEPLCRWHNFMIDLGDDDYGMDQDRSWQVSGVGDVRVQTAARIRLHCYYTAVP